MDKIRTKVEIVRIAEIRPLFDIIKEFIQSIGQQSVLKQYESVYDEYISVNSSRYSLVDEFERIFVRLSEIYIWYPMGDSSLKSKHERILEWLKQLRRELGACNGISAIIFQDVYQDYVQLYNRSFKLNTPAKAAKLGSQLMVEFSNEAKSSLLKSEIEILAKRIEDLVARKLKLTNNPDHLNELKLRYSYLGVQIISYFQEKQVDQGSFFWCYNLNYITG